MKIFFRFLLLLLVTLSTSMLRAESYNQGKGAWVNGAFYGTTSYGGTASLGTVFRIAPGGVPVTLASFTGANGANPNGILVGADGNFYGTTSKGGASGKGLAFKMTPAGVVSVFAPFTSPGLQNLSSPLILATDGNFYGTSLDGGANSRGAIYKLTPTGVASTYYSFDDLGYHPIGLVQSSDGNFYGMTDSSGRQGSIFKLTPGLVYTSLVDFSFYSHWEGTSDIDYDYFESGEVPTNIIAGLGGAIYFSTMGFTFSDHDTPKEGHTYTSTHYSRIFRLDQSVQENYVVLATLDNPRTTLLQGSDTQLHGASFDDTGTDIPPIPSLFTLTLDGTLTSELLPPQVNAPFRAFLDGISPAGSLFLETDSYNFGTVNNLGIRLVELNPDGELVFPFSIRHNFGDGSVAGDGTAPSLENLIQGFDGALYGITQTGGFADAGTIFKLKLADLVTIPYSFGKVPIAEEAKGQGLFQASDGFFYGTTNVGGAADKGTIFRMNNAGSVTILHSFGVTAGDGAQPTAGVFEANDGYLYGTTSNGGAKTVGTLFRMSLKGDYSLLYSFGTIKSDGAHPFCHMIQAKDGALYGTTNSGGKPGSKGTIFKYTLANAYSILHNFADGSVANDGQQPQRELVQTSDGTFYGVTARGGTANLGTVYSMTPAGQVEILHGFGDGSVTDDGANPFGSGLALGVDGVLYGTTTYGGGTANAGTAFALDPATEDYSVIKRFSASPTDGSHPSATLIQAVDNSFYGVTQDGGIAGGGTLFSLYENQFSLLPPVAVGPKAASLGAGVPGSFRLLVQPPATLWNASNLPPGLTIDTKTGVISGTPTAKGTYASVKIKATNAGGYLLTPVTLTIVAREQRITFPAVPNPHVGTVAELQATSSSGLPVTYSVSGPTTLSESTLKITGDGTVVVSADQSGNAIYAAAPQVVQRLTVPPRSPPGGG